MCLRTGYKVYSVHNYRGTYYYELHCHAFMIINISIEIKKLTSNNVFKIEVHICIVFNIL